jgi:hypothetical protein
VYHRDSSNAPFIALGKQDWASPDATLGVAYLLIMV